MAERKIGAYRMLKKERIIVQYFSGEISIDDIIFFNKHQSLCAGYNPGFSVVADFRDVDITDKISEVERYVAFVQNNPRVLAKRDVALLTSKPNEVVLASIYQILTENLPINPFIFSTLEAATAWVSNSLIDPGYINDIIGELKSQPDNILAER